MAHWIFKLSRQRQYPDIPSKKYVYDNRHSTRVTRGDVFLYLDKTKGYSFTGTGTVNKVSTRKPNLGESRLSDKIRAVHTAHLSDVITFSERLSISASTSVGKVNRAILGIVDVNQLGWSRSISLISEVLYQTILELAEIKQLVPPNRYDQTDFSVPDTWGKTKTRRVMKSFSDQVLSRSRSTCVVCGTSVEGLVDAAHLSPYATDKTNRANPANGVCLCKYCHRALDLRLIAICPSGELLVSPLIEDGIAHLHFSRLSAKQRKEWLAGVDTSFLEKTVNWFEDRLGDNASSLCQVSEVGVAYPT